MILPTVHDVYKSQVSGTLVFIRLPDGKEFAVLVDVPEKENRAL